MSLVNNNNNDSRLLYNEIANYYKLNDEDWGACLDLSYKAIRQILSKFSLKAHEILDCACWIGTQAMLLIDGEDRRTTMMREITQEEIEPVFRELSMECFVRDDIYYYKVIILQKQCEQNE